MKKRFLIPVAVIIALASVILCSCSGGGKSETVSMYDLKTAMANATDKFDDMTYASSEDADKESIFANISEMDYSKVDSFFVFYATNGTGNADEIAVIQVKNSSDLTAARESLEAHLAKRKSLYSTYDKTQLKKLDGAKVVTGGNCAALIVGDDAGKISEAFYEFFK